MSAANFFNDEQKKLIAQAIHDAELNTSGEIRVHIEEECKEDVMDHAAYIFETLGMHKTKLRNGVLFYLAIKDHKFAILGDAGINAKAPEGFWDIIKVHMLKHFKEGRFTEGLCEGIKMAGEELKKDFPFLKGDTNELSNEMTFSKKDK